MYVTIYVMDYFGLFCGTVRDAICTSDKFWSRTGLPVFTWLDHPLFQHNNQHCQSCHLWCADFINYVIFDMKIHQFISSLMWKFHQLIYSLKTSSLHYIFDVKTSSIDVQQCLFLSSWMWRTHHCFNQLLDLTSHNYLQVLKTITKVWLTAHLDHPLTQNPSDHDQSTQTTVPFIYFCGSQLFISVPHPLMFSIRVVHRHTWKCYVPTEPMLYFLVLFVLVKKKHLKKCFFLQYHLFSITFF